MNTFRITTLNLNGVTTVLTRVFKVGASGYKVDNSASGGVMIGVSPEGILDSIGFLANGEVIREANNVLFKGYSFPFFEKIESLALKLHSRIDNLHIIGWDITLDANGKALLIEANATWPAISVPQLCCGPLFGERTQEIISYCKKNQHLLPNKVFNI